MAYAAPAQLQDYLGIDTTEDDALLVAMLTRAQAAVDGMTQRTFEAAADTVRYFDWRAIGARMLYLDADFCAITSVVNGDGITVGAGSYTTEPRNVTPWHALLLRATADVAWDGITGDIAITGKWAYSATAPADVVQATIRLAAWLYRQKDNTGNDQPVIAGNATILPSRIPSDVADLLRPYTRVLV
jgi:hypothetical protein